MAADEQPPAFSPVNPYALARNEALAAQLKRFYKDVAVEPRDGQFVLLLDGREARTPSRQPLGLPTAAAAALVAEEWMRQGDIILPGSMPVTRLANSVIDGVATATAAVATEIVRYAGTDLVCYRADTPAELVARQAEAWDPVLAIARERWNARLYLAEGIVHVSQPGHAMAGVERAVTDVVGTGPAAPFRLGALHVMTTLSGSALLALAVMTGAMDVASAWWRAHVDEDFEIGRWGEDAEASLRRESRWRDMAGAAALAVAVTD